MDQESAVSFETAEVAVTRALELSEQATDSRIAFNFLLPGAREFVIVQSKPIDGNTLIRLVAEKQQEIAAQLERESKHSAPEVMASLIEAVSTGMSQLAAQFEPGNENGGKLQEPESGEKSDAEPKVEAPEKPAKVKEAKAPKAPKAPKEAKEAKAKVKKDDGESKA